MRPGSASRATNILVTGGAGFIGCNFVHFWLARHPEDSVVVLDALTYAGNVANLEPVLSNPRLTFVRGDIRDEELVATLLRTHRVSVVVHFAAESHVDRSIAGPDPFLATNVLGTHGLLQAARQVWLEEGPWDQVCFHHVSTDEVYGSLAPDDPPFTEHSRYAPSSTYAASKAASDHLVQAYHRTYGLPVTTTTCTNNYGPYQFPEKLIPLMLVNMLDGKPLPVYGDGLHIRDWLYVEDHCRAVESVLQQGAVGETYHVSGGSECKNIDLVRLLCGLLDEAFRADPSLAGRFPRSPAAAGCSNADLITFVRDRPGHDRRYGLDATKIQQHSGFRPRESFEGGMRKTVGWYLAHEPWWRAVMDGSYREWVRANYDARSA